MNKLDSNFQTLIHPENTASHLDHGSSHRLIVLIQPDSDYTSAAGRIADLATASDAPVIFLGLCKGWTQEPSLRRQLITLSALLQDARIDAESRVEIGTNWLDLVGSNYQDGDMIVCFAEQRAGLWHRPLSQILQANIDAPLYILADFLAQDQPQSNWLSQITAWSGSVGIIIGFFLLQIRITSYPQDWAQTTLMILSVVGESWLIWVWNTLFS